MARPLKFLLSDTTLTSDVNQTLSNLLKQINTVKKTVTTVGGTATRALSIAGSNPTSLESLTDVLIKAVVNGQTITWNGVDWVNTDLGVSFKTSGLGGFWSAGYPMGMQFGQNTTAATVSTTSEQVTVFQFTLDASWTISRVTAVIATNSSGNSVNFGIYNSSGSKLIDSGALSATSTGAISASITAVTLPPGVYYFAQSANNTSIQVTGFSNASSPMTTALNAHGTVKVGQAANATSAGVMPATLGTITADTLGLNMAGAFFGV